MDQLWGQSSKNKCLMLTLKKDQQWQSDSKTNVALFEVLTTISMSLVKPSQVSNPQYTKLETNEWQWETLDPRIPPPWHKLSTGFIVGLPTYHISSPLPYQHISHAPFPCLIYLETTGWQTGVSYEGRGRAVGLWMIQALIYGVSEGRQR